MLWRAAELPAYYNAAPTTALPVVRQGKEGREIALMKEGLIPFFSKDGKPSYSTISARAEGVRTNASYREPFKTRRCIVPASGYFEWTGPFTIITTEPSRFAARFHDRMPLILEPDTWYLWMTGDADAAATLMKPVNEDALISRPVSKTVGNVKNNTPDLLKAL